MLQKTLIILPLLIINGEALQCYACNSALTPSCLYNNKNVKIMNCLDDYICISYQLEHISNEGKFEQIVRGCQHKIDTDPCKLLLTEKQLPDGSINRGQYCYTCETNLCNNSTNIETRKLLLIALIVFWSIY